MNRRKYNARRTTFEGIEFDSAREARRYAELKLLEKAGEIRNLQLQVEFELVPTQRDEKGELVEQKVKYIADFVYFGKDGRVVVEDAKGYTTKDFIIKRKLMLYKYGIRIREV